MAKLERRVYAPASPPPGGLRPTQAEEDGGGRGQVLLYAVILVVLVALGVVLFSAFGGRPAPTIVADGPYKVAGPGRAAPDPTEQRASADSGAPARLAPAPEEPLPRTAIARPSAAPPAPAAEPAILGAGPYVAQIAAVQAEAEAAQEWRRLARRAPNLFGRAKLDVRRADLGQDGVRYRIRAGYFANREEAQRFCERLRSMAVDCLATPR